MKQSTSFASRMTNGEATLRSNRTKRFNKRLRRLPSHIQDRFESLFQAFQNDPNDPVLQTEPLHDSRKGKHRNGSRSVRITLRYRAIYVIDRGEDGTEEEQYSWYWIGSREDYGSFIGSR